MMATGLLKLTDFLPSAFRRLSGTWISGYDKVACVLRLRQGAAHAAGPQAGDMWIPPDVT